MSTQPISFFKSKLKYIPVNKLSKYDFCSKAAKIDLFMKPKFIHGDSIKAMSEGSRFHAHYSLDYKSFSRLELLGKLERFGKVFERVFNDEYVIRGIPDDFIVNHKLVSIIEVRTVNERVLTKNQVAAKIFQLQLYIWILEPILTKLGYTLNSDHYLEIYSQVTKKLIHRVIVNAEPNMINKLSHIFNSFKGVESMSTVPFYVCKSCYNPIKNLCDWHKMMSDTA